MSSFDSLIVFSGISFILYGILAFITEQSQKEFVRWGFEKQRILIGSMGSYWDNRQGTRDSREEAYSVRSLNSFSRRKDQVARIKAG